MLVVNHIGVVIRKDFGPIDCTTREGVTAEFETESYCFVVTDSSVRNCFAVMYLLVKGLQAREDVVHDWNAVGVNVV